ALEEVPVAAQLSSSRRASFEVDVQLLRLDVKAVSEARTPCDTESAARGGAGSGTGSTHHDVSASFSRATGRRAFVVAPATRWFRGRESSLRPYTSLVLHVTLVRPELVPRARVISPPIRRRWAAPRLQASIRDFVVSVRGAVVHVNHLEEVEVH